MTHHMDDGWLTAFKAGVKARAKESNLEVLFLAAKPEGLGANEQPYLWVEFDVRVRAGATTTSRFDDWCLHLVRTVAESVRDSRSPSLFVEGRVNLEVTRMGTTTPQTLDGNGFRVIPEPEPDHRTSRIECWLTADGAGRPPPPYGATPRRSFASEFQTFVRGES